MRETETSPGPAKPSRARPFEPLIPAACALAVGLYIPVPPVMAVCMALVAASAAVAALAVPAKMPKLAGALCLAVACGLVLGVAARFSEEWRKAGAGFGLPVGRVARVEGILVRDSAPIRGGTRYLLELDACSDTFGAGASAGGRLVIIATPAGRGMEAGTHVAVEGRFSPEQAGDGFISFNPRLAILSEPTGFRGIRAVVFRSLESAASRVGTVSTPLLKALLLGIREDLDRETQDLFKRAGCSHILALSGQHLSVLASLAIALSSPALGSFVALGAATVLVAAYAAVVGAEASVLRGALMFTLMALGRLRGRPNSPLNALAASFVIQASLFPETAFQWSFILSYLAMAGLVKLAPAFDFALKPRIGAGLSAAFSASLGATVASFPFCAVAFGAVYPGGILAATAAGPVSALFLWTGTLGVAAVSAFPFLVGPVSSIVDIAYRALVFLLEAGAAFPALELGPGPPRIIAIGVVALAAGLVYAWPHVQYFRYRSFPDRL
ncbi:MAG: ComEC/Rec2 family competence protein [Spirochaetes bacterium]|nr:ComEC/Rec2 family competence protein [Spirochaetota bacterium]